MSTKTAPAPASADALPEDAELAALRRDLQLNKTYGRVVQGFVALIILVITAYGTSNAHEALHRHDTPDPWGWMLYPAVEAALIVELQAGAYVGRILNRIRKNSPAGGEKAKKKFNWGMAMRLATALAAILLNIWYPIEVHDGRGAILHVVGPVLQIFIVEALAHYRDAFAEIDRHFLDAIAAREAAIVAAVLAPRTRSSVPARPPVVPAPVPPSSPDEKPSVVLPSSREEDAPSPSSPPRPPESKEAVLPPADPPSPPKDKLEDGPKDLDEELIETTRIGIARLKAREMSPTRDNLKVEMGMSSKRATIGLAYWRPRLDEISPATFEELALIPQGQGPALHVVENAS